MVGRGLVEEMDDDDGRKEGHDSAKEPQHHHHHLAVIVYLLWTSRLSNDAFGVGRAFLSAFQVLDATASQIRRAFFVHQSAAAERFLALLDQCYTDKHVECSSLLPATA